MLALLRFGRHFVGVALLGRKRVAVMSGGSVGRQVVVDVAAVVVVIVVVVVVIVVVVDGGRLVMLDGQRLAGFLVEIGRRNGLGRVWWRERLGLDGVVGGEGSAGRERALGGDGRVVRGGGGVGDRGNGGRRAEDADGTAAAGVRGGGG